MVHYVPVLYAIFRTGQGMVSGLLAKVVNEMVINLHEEQIYNFMIKRDQNELQLSMVETTEKCN